MSWTYKITSGAVVNPDSVQTGFGYAGHGEGLNNPAMVSTPDVGPLPSGKYKISPAHDDPHVGKFAMRLTPDPANEMYGRAGFFIHGDNPKLNHSASDGCIILVLAIRKTIATSNDDELNVEV